MNLKTQINMKATTRHLLFFPLVWLLFSCQDKAEEYTVSKKTLREAVYASGEILPMEYEYITSTSTDRILRILVEEGDSVKAGQVLAVLGTSNQDGQMEILSRQVAIARENASERSAAVAELEERIALAQQRYRQDSLDARRYAALAETQAVPRRQSEETVMRAESSRREYNGLRQQLRSLRNELKNQVLAAESQLEQYRGNRENRVLTSRIGGRVFSIHAKEGETVHANSPIMLVGTPDSFRLELLVDERDIAKIKPGQEVVFETDIYAGEQFRGRLWRIRPVLQQENRSFEVDVEVRDTAVFYPRSLIEANIIVRDSSTVLAMPTDFLLPDDQVWKKSTEGKPVHVSVETGARDGELVEIRNGMEEGDIVLKKAP